VPSSSNHVAVRARGARQVLEREPVERERRRAGDRVQVDGALHLERVLERALKGDLVAHGLVERVDRRVRRQVLVDGLASFAADPHLAVADPELGLDEGRLAGLLLLRLRLLRLGRLRRELVVELAVGALLDDDLGRDDLDVGDVLAADGRAHVDPHVDLLHLDERIAEVLRDQAEVVDLHVSRPADRDVADRGLRLELLLQDGGDLRLGHGADDRGSRRERDDDQSEEDPAADQGDLLPALHPGFRSGRRRSGSGRRRCGRILSRSRFRSRHPFDILLSGPDESTPAFEQRFQIQ
jgi:hypothetical protein